MLRKVLSRLMNADWVYELGFLFSEVFPTVVSRSFCAMNFVSLGSRSTAETSVLWSHPRPNSSYNAWSSACILDRTRTKFMVVPRHATSDKWLAERMLFAAQVDHCIPLTKRYSGRGTWKSLCPQIHYRSHKLGYLYSVLHFNCGAKWATWRWCNFVKRWQGRFVCSSATSCVLVRRSFSVLLSCSLYNHNYFVVHVLLFFLSITLLLIFIIMVWLIKGVLTGLGLIKAAADSGSPVCTKNLLVDDYAKWSSNTNSLGQWTSGE